MEREEECACSPSTIDNENNIIMYVYIYKGIVNLCSWSPTTTIPTRALHQLQSIAATNTPTDERIIKHQTNHRHTQKTTTITTTTATTTAVAMVMILPTIRRRHLRRRTCSNRILVLRTHGRVRFASDLMLQMPCSAVYATLRGHM